MTLALEVPVSCTDIMVGLNATRYALAVPGFIPHATRTDF